MEYPYEEEEEGMVYEEDEEYPLDGTLSEDQEPPYTPTPSSVAPSLAPEVASTRPPLEKQASLHQQQQPPQTQPPFHPMEPHTEVVPKQQSFEDFGKPPSPPLDSQQEPFAPAAVPPTPAAKPVEEPKPPTEPSATERPPEALSEKTEAPPER